MGFKIKTRHSNIFSASLAAALLVFAPAAWSLPDMQFMFKSNQELVELESGERHDIINRLTEIVSSCEYPQISRKDWKEKLFSPYGFHIIYSRPMAMSFPTFANGYQTTAVREISEIMLPLDTDPPERGIFVRTSDDKWTFLFKCDGAKMIDLVCKPELQQYYPDNGEAYQLACSNRKKPEDELKDANATPPEASPVASEGNAAAPASGDSGDEWSELAPPPQNADDLKWEDPQKTTAVEVQGDELIIQ